MSKFDEAKKHLKSMFLAMVDGMSDEEVIDLVYTLDHAVGDLKITFVDSGAGEKKPN